MENSTQFDLNTALSCWRANLSQSPNFRTGDLAELESHLHDSITAWQTKGLSDEEAFLIATRRLGPTHTLASEFAKVNSGEVWLDRLLWMAIGIQLFWLCSSLSSTLANTAVIGLGRGFGYHFRAQGWEAFTLPALFFALARLLALVLAIWTCWFLLRHKGEKLSIIASRVLRRPFAVGLVAIAGLSILVRSAFMTHLLFMRWFSQAEYASIILSTNIAEIILPLFTIIALAALTVFLARRRLRPQTIK